MSNKLLRLEAVNLAYSIEDTEDLGTRRGGSLMLLEAIRHVEDKFAKSQKVLERISNGASAGLFKILDEKQGTAQAVLAELAGHATFRHATFVADVVTQNGSDFAGATDDAIAANRWRQMQTLSFSSFGLGRSDAGICEVDEVRPAQHSTTVKSAAAAVSESVQARRGNGMQRKQDFYARELAPAADPTSGRYCKDFEDLATAMPSTIRPATLDGKIAVFYADGNKFGRVAQACKTPGELTGWDGYVKASRQAFLAQLLKRAANESRWQNSAAAGAVRLETLLWGGDELMMVVPAWCGMELAELFFLATQGMRFPVNGGPPLSHCCGLVFCHRQAPISGISALAKALADQGKAMNKASGQLENRLHWMVMESFDQAGGDMEGFLQRRFAVRRTVGGIASPVVAWRDLALSRPAVATLQRDFPALKEHLPRSAVVHIARRMAEGSAFVAGQDAHPLVKRSYRQVIGAASEAGQRAAFDGLWSALTGSAPPPDAAAFEPVLGHLPAWATIAELWDYCVPLPTAALAAGGVQ